MRISLIFPVVLLFSCAQEKKAPVLPPQREGAPPAPARHLLPDASGTELRIALEAVSGSGERSARWVSADVANSRVYAWQAVLNAKRPPERQLRFDRGLRAIPIEKPAEYNAELNEAAYQEALDALPAELREVLTDPKRSYPESISLPDADFEKLCLQIIRAYQRITRWEALAPYLQYYRNKAFMDVRGYYFLEKEPRLQEQLQGWALLSSADRERLSGWLLGLCLNEGKDLENCRTELGAGDAAGFYRRYREAGEKLFHSYFSLPRTRNDVRWFREAALEGPELPFTDPGAGKLDHVKGSIEGAWKGEGWALRLVFTDRRDDSTTRIEFQPGALPHVNRLAGSQIVMDANTPLTNEMNSSLFSHEYGHVLGFPDCYVEFYDAARAVMVNYQIRPEDIMCSRVGKVSERHFTQLKAAHGQTAREPSQARPKRSGGARRSQRQPTR